MTATVKFWLFAVPLIALTAIVMSIAVCNDITSIAENRMCEPKPTRELTTIERVVSWPPSVPAQLCVVTLPGK
jgi:hypothetical protein